MIPSTARGEMTVEDGVGVVTVTNAYPTTVDDLWEAISSARRLARWFGDVRPRSDGHVYDADLTTGWEGVITVTSCDPPREVRAELTDGDSTTTVHATVSASERGAVLTIQERGLPVDDLPTYAAGWHAQFDILAAVTGGQAEPGRWEERWRQLIPPYRKIRVVRVLTQKTPAVEAPPD